MKYICEKIETNLIINGDLGKQEWGIAKKILLVDTVSGSKNTQKKVLFLR
ncbi:MAG TPA: hypothetical protein VIK78_16150 [Ruminiclostridium sp.]